ncbi:putative ribonuclease H-like domain-containing protein [Tanacetum coccineum]
MSNSRLEEFQQPEFEGYGPKTSKSVCEDISNEVRESPDTPLVEKLVSGDKLEKKIVSPTVAKIDFVRPKQQEKPVRKPVKERVVSENNYTRVNYNYSAKKAHPSAHRNIIPRAVLMKTSLRSLNTARPVHNAHPKTTVYSARPMSHFSNSAQSTVKRPYQIRTTLTNKNFSQKVNTAKGKFYTARPKAVNTTRPNSAVANAVRENQGHPQKEDQGYVDSRCSRHMTGHMSYFSDFKEFNGGYITFRVGAKAGKITASKDETSGILKRFITEIENLVDKKVKMIRCDDGTEFKNRVMKRRNRTLIEAARTMLADSKLPTTFRVEAVNTACYVQNKVLVVKPHNKTPYELFRDRTPALSFMRPFGCHVTILNTLDYLGKFDRKSNEGFFIRYSMNSKAFRVYNIRTRKIEENLHIRFLEDKPIIAGDGPKWLFDIDVLIKSMNFMQLLPNASNDEPQPSSDTGKKEDEGVNKESGFDDQERPENNTQDVNIVSPTFTTAPLEATHADFFGDETEVDMSNITTIYQVPFTPNTRIQKDHSLDHVIGDVQSGVQTRRMIKTTNEQGFISVVYEGKTHEDLHICLFACFLSQEEPKKVWTLLDLPHGKRAIGTKWVSRHTKDEKQGLVNRKQGKTGSHGLWYRKDSPFDLEAYTNSDYAGASLDRKSTTRAEYVAAASCCGQVLWIQNQMLDYGYNFMNTKIFIDNESTICIVKNPVFHSKTKHIEIRHHFIRDSNEKKLIQMIKIHISEYAQIMLETESDDAIQVSFVGLTYYWKQRKDTKVPQPSGSIEPITDEAANEEHVPTHSNDLFLSGEDRLQLKELLELCTKLSARVLDLENTMTSQDAEITKLKERVKKLERRNKSRTPGLKRLRKGRNDDAVSPPVITEVEITLAQTLAELKSAKSKVVIQEPVQSTVTTAPSTILKAKGITFRDAGETTTRTPTSVSSSSIKDKWKAKMVELEVPLNKKDQIRLDEELGQEQGELTIEEKSKLFMELMNERKRHFAKLRAEEKKITNKRSERNQMCTYLKNMGGFTHNQLKNKSYKEIQKAFDKTMGWINNFKPMDSEEVKSNEKKAEGSRNKSIGKKIAGNE